VPIGPKWQATVNHASTAGTVSVVSVLAIEGSSNSSSSYLLTIARQLRLIGPVE
jgi:hypothetical protein